MRFIRSLLMAASLGFTSLMAAASPAQPVNGVDYRTLEQPQSTEAGTRVEVIEFFWYACPHCNAFEPALEEWVSKQGDAIVFKRVPVQFGHTPEQLQRFVPQQKLYYTLEAMGKLDELHAKVFQAIHSERQRLDSDAAVVGFAEQHGLDKQHFWDLYNSFAVQTKVQRAIQLQQAYRIRGVPTIAIDGRYLTALSMVAESIGRQPDAILQNGTLQVMAWLLKQSGKGANQKP